MFWIGAAAGAAAVLLIIASGLGMILYSVAKQREQEVQEGNRFKVEAQRAYDYWDRAINLMEVHNGLLRQQNEVLRNRRGE